MKMSSLVSKRYKETPADVQIASHILMLRGGYIRAVGNGIYSLLPVAKRITNKIETIIREEMDAIGGQEVLLPIVMPASLWRDSGRYSSIGSELLRFKDRTGNDMVLGMTHEEAAVQLVKDYADTYQKYPFMVYQIQTKFRDEPRSRGGLIRVREFSMKDAYSFHTTQSDLEEYYNKCLVSYARIFSRVGIPEVIAVESDSGMMGGNTAHEFMLLTDIGEDSLAICSHCSYRSNLESATCTYNYHQDTLDPLTKFATPNVSSINDLSEYYSVPTDRICKAVVYTTANLGKQVVIFIRGDLDVNETKVRNHLREDIFPDQINETSRLVKGYIGPIALDRDCLVIFDRSLEGVQSFVAGANEIGYHFSGVNTERDIGKVDFVDVAKMYEGAICPKCGKPDIRISRGIELGNIFQLGDRYTSAMGLHYIGEDGGQNYPLMGCYGIGIGRLLASICQARHDERGPIWPLSVAPWQVHICSLRADDENVHEVSSKLYQELINQRVETIWDDRQVSAGVAFSDADLLGIPYRLIVSPKGLKEGIVEICDRGKTFIEKASVNDVLARLRELLS